MKITKRIKEITVDGPPPLIVPDVAGHPLLTFDGEIVESLRHMVTKLYQKSALPRQISVVSALRNEGVSYISQALAATIAYDLNLRVCLVDLNFWWPDNLFLHNEESQSWADVIEDQIAIRDAIVPTGWENLSLLPAGNIPRQQRTMMANSAQLRNLVEDLSREYDQLIFDVPAILATPDAVALASLGTSCCLVIRQGITHSGDVGQALDEIEHLNIIGAVLNKVRLETPSKLMRMIAF